MKRKVKELIKEVRHSSADVRIGKAGVSERVLSEIKRRLKEKGVIKVKMLKSALKVEGKDRFEIAKKVAEKVGARLIEVRGRTFILLLPEEVEKKLKTPS